MLANSVDEPAAETEVLFISALQSRLEKTCTAIYFAWAGQSAPYAEGQANRWRETIANHHSLSTERACTDDHKEGRPTHLPGA